MFLVRMHDDVKVQFPAMTKLIHRTWLLVNGNVECVVQGKGRTEQLKKLGKCYFYLDTLHQWWGLNLPEGGSPSVAVGTAKEMTLLLQIESGDRILKSYQPEVIRLLSSVKAIPSTVHWALKTPEPTCLPGWPNCHQPILLSITGWGFQILQVHLC